MEIMLVERTSDKATTPKTNRTIVIAALRRQPASESGRKRGATNAAKRAAAAIRISCTEVSKRGVWTAHTTHVNFLQSFSLYSFTRLFCRRDFSIMIK